MTEKHPLLTETEFRDMVVQVGHTRYMSGALFNALGRANERKFGKRRTSENIRYEEMPRGSEVSEHIVSIPNLQLHLRELIDEKLLKAKQQIAAALIVEYVMPDDEFSIDAL